MRIPRALGPVGQVEQLRDGIEGVERVCWGHHEALVVALARPQHLPQVALLGLGGHPRRGAGAHDVDEDGGDLHDARHAERLGHQREAAAGGGAHGAGAGVRRPDNHVGHRDFALALPDHDAELTGVRGHPVQHPRGGAHRIGAVELDPRGGGAHRQGVVPGPYRLGFGARRDVELKRLELVLREGEAGLGHADILVDDLLALAPELQRQGVLEHLKV